MEPFQLLTHPCLDCGRFTQIMYRGRRSGGRRQLPRPQPGRALGLAAGTNTKTLCFDTGFHEISWIFDELCKILR